MDSDDNESRQERLAAIEAAEKLETEERRKAAAEKQAQKEEFERS